MPQPRKPEAPARVGGRYLLGARIGGGAQGEVFAATDALSGDEAAEGTRAFIEKRLPAWAMEYAQGSSA